MKKKVKCPICPRACVLAEGERGFCQGRINRGGEVIAENYGRITAIALDPIEKKPLRRFYESSQILSVGSYGCNLRCPFCQNYRISMENQPGNFIEISPKDLVIKAEELVGEGNIGLAYTYNEPLIGYEFVRDTSRIAKEYGLKNVLVTNGYINEEPLIEILDLIDGFNIDLKSFRDSFYREIGGDLETVKRSIYLASQKCHLEVTCLIIPEKNDSQEEMEDLSTWLASVDPDIPLHISRFYPSYKVTDRRPTPVETIRNLAEIARKHLSFVYTGNM